MKDADYLDNDVTHSIKVKHNAFKTVVTIVFKKETIKDTEQLFFRIANVQTLAENLLDPSTVSGFIQITDNISLTLVAAVVQTVQGRLEFTFSKKVSG